MGLFDKIKGFMGDPEDDDYDLEQEEKYQMIAEILGPYTGNLFVTPKEVDAVAAPAADTTKRGNKVVNIHATAQLQVVLVKPERFDDASTVADHLNSKRTVVLNLESANKDVARRILDFLSGVAYANDGQIKKVANCTFIITPYNVGIMGDLLDELENNGLYF